MDQRGKGDNKIILDQHNSYGRVSFYIAANVAVWLLQGYFWVLNFYGYLKVV